MRKFLLPTLIIASALLILTRLYYLQILDDSYIKKSENNAVKIKYQYPERGYIYDRNDVLMVANQPSYDIIITPNEIEKDIDTLEVCRLLNVTPDYFCERLRKARVYSPRLPYTFLSQLNKKEFSAFQEKIRRFKGFDIVKRSLRDYRIHAASNVFGYIAQVGEATIDKNSYYKSGDLIGRQGVEQVYEEVLRGKKGTKRIQKDRFNREIGPFKGGIYDTISVKGKDITLTLDSKLQEYGESLMFEKRGGIVALEPKTGEILALVTAPTYDPSLLVGRNRSKNYRLLEKDTLGIPLYDRGLLAEYPPGSPFKIITGLIGLQEGVINEYTSFKCHYGFSYGRGAFMRCHDFGRNKLNEGIFQSCNTYFASTFRLSIDKYPTPELGIEAWGNHLKSFGLGNYLGYDLPPGRKGLVPDAKLYKRYYPRGGWRSSTIISNAIGQGEILMTPIQLANMMATVANKGYYYTPHIIKDIKGQKIDEKFTTKHTTSIDQKHFEPIIEGLHDVYNLGTAKTLQIEGIEICGKTGTAENYTKIDGVKTQLTDHSIFVAFAPKDDPKIAVAVFVENGYWGARWAGPIATLMIEKYLKGTISRKDLEVKMLTRGLKEEYKKVISGKPFSINQ
ncbi:MAG: penicillin-binding protein 2 [Flavobacterium sp. MedPE-SWcel]|uniref:penicillin-binding protein 2 n=1 Tax=uncultured Flavobacterium sp. TaxID=165435 RepID=UPI00091BBBD8|nr:penicillin-binding protein 2 [uncultured Flavobacterium sp.]OIQ21805.1 MAG: penicillin-binding protein 2 [Flavobacterium sp. MedPE-SWcel]